jgi:hypothetical protein
MRIALTLLFVVVAASLAAQDCADWSTTMRLPDVYSDFRFETILVAGSRLIGADDNTVSVVDLEDDGSLTLLGSVQLAQYVGRLRQVGDDFYIFSRWVDGVFRLDLSDPTQPTVVELNLPIGSVRDLVALGDDALVMCDAGVYVVDDPGAEEPSMLSELVTVPYAARAVIWNDLACVAADQGITYIDFSDHAQPQASPLFDYEPGVSWFDNITAKQMVVVGSTLVLHIIYNHAPWTHETSVAVDLEDFANGAILARADLDPKDIVVNNDRLLVLRRSVIDEVTPRDLDRVRSFGLSSGGSSMALVGDHVYLSSSGADATSRYDFTDPVVIDNEFEFPAGYSALDCGPIGISIERTYDSYWEGYGPVTYLTDVDWVVHDQTVPGNLTEMTAGHLDVHPGEDNFGFARFDGGTWNDRWAVVELERSAWWAEIQVDHLVYDRQDGSVVTIDMKLGGESRLDGDVLWTRRIVSPWSYPTEELVTYRLEDDGVVELGNRMLPAYSYSRTIHLDDEVYVVYPDGIEVYDRDDPSSLVPIRAFSVGPDVTLEAPGVIRDGLLYNLDTEGLTVIDLHAMNGDPVVLGRCALDSNVDDGIMLDGSLVLVVCSHWVGTGWRIVDVSDPTAPTVVSSQDVRTLGHALLSDDRLYVNTGYAVHSYDVSNLAQPEWRGQSAGYLGSTSLCWLAGYLTVDGHCFLPDCDQPTSVDPGLDPPSSTPMVGPNLAASPNPFNPTTTVSFDLDRRQHVDLAIYDLRGRRVVTLLDQACDAGHHRVRWQGVDREGRSVPSGTYVAQLATGAMVRSAKVALVR